VWAEDKDDLEAMDFSPGTNAFVPDYKPKSSAGETPDVVRKFVNQFDMGKLPELIDYIDFVGRCHVTPNTVR
jgi:hypothetical protein